MAHIHETPDDGTVDPMRLQPGDVIELFDGQHIRVVENPRDGIWVFGADADTSTNTGSEPIYADDIRRVVTTDPQDTP